SMLTLQSAAFNPFVGAPNAGTIYVDMTGYRAWNWSDFASGIQLTIDQHNFAGSHYVYYDAVGLRVTTGTGTDNSSPAVSSTSANAPLDTSQMANVFPSTVRATNVWNSASNLQGQGDFTVAVVDSGIVKTKDLAGHVLNSVNFNSASHSSLDGYGHGTFVAEI